MMRTKMAVLLGAVAAAGIPIESIPMPKDKKQRIFTHSDEERLLKAKDKRERKASKRLKQ